MLDKMKNLAIISHVPAGVAHLVERHLAKVEVASSSLVTRSIKKDHTIVWSFFFCGKWRGRRLEKPDTSLPWRFVRRQTRWRRHHNVSSLVTRSGIKEARKK